MDVISKFWNDKKQYDDQHPVEMVRDRVYENPNLNLSILKQNIDNIDNLPDVDLKNFIFRSYKSILSNLFTGKDSAKYVRSFQNKRFLDVFSDVLSSLSNIEQDDIIAINTLCYHYLTLDKKQQDQSIVSRMLKLSSIVNRYCLPGLLGLGLSTRLATMLLIARFSDIDLNICVKRVNFIIITQPLELLNEKLVEEILRKLYNVMEMYYRIFPYFMMDTLPDYNENDETTFWITDDIDEANSILNLSMLNILDNLPSQLIRESIKNYSEGQRMAYSKSPVRFSLRNLSDDYYRISDVVNSLIYNEDVDVP